ncbi:DUF1203 domain-containing protein [Roseateles sp. DAIF2]|uniref:DUF1203 domain-containing protein n=1 Tax=Roseateles sp. DAIF2 TaxID=2714952 RepID=UPI001BC9D2D6|nr:DUF1203 domain-containing protein [Roseateles sp. DAIF2]
METAMTRYRIAGLSPEPFRPLFGLSDAELAERHILRRHVPPGGGLPDRIELRDAQPGESCLLLNYCHLDLPSPYRASHAIFVREGAERAFEAENQLPEMLRKRLLSLRAFNAQGLIVEAGVVEGRLAEGLIGHLLDLPSTAFIHAHFAGHGCYAARITRA